MSALPRPVAFVAGALCTMAWAATLMAQAPPPGVPPLTIASMDGKDLFTFYCAPCHGADAKGHGPVAAALKTPPPDLTRLAARHGGTFPREQTEAAVAGDRPLTAHGSSEMPVWGPVFRGLDAREQVNRMRIANIVRHLESIQAR